MKITIFGCCRQDPLYNIYDITPIRNKLTYTHYGQEILQAIKFCKRQGRESIKNRFMFRSLILNPDKNIKCDFKKHFDNTDLFVVELASRKSHFFKECWLHEAYRDPVYSFETPDDVSVRDATADEITAFIKDIVKELRPKKVMFVTHVYTAECQNRKILSSEIKHACAGLNVPVFDPVEQFGGQDIIKNYLVPEKVIAHYTDEGSKLLQTYYEKFIYMEFGYRSSPVKKTYKKLLGVLKSYLLTFRRSFQ